MDTSLARGLKNQLFRELSDELDAVTKRWRAYCEISGLKSGRHKWEKFCDGVDDIWGSFLLAKHKGGSKRKPFLCLATFDHEVRQYNSWNERSVFSYLFYCTINPMWADSVPIGFSISDHAIQRIFERSYNDIAPTNINFRKIDFTNELRFALPWCVFWTTHAINKFRNSDIASIEIFIPSPNGLLLGEVLRDTHFCIEIRTFLSEAQLSSKHRNLFESMVKASDKFHNSVVPFLLVEHISKQSGVEEEFKRFIADTQNVYVALRTMHGVEI